MSWKILTPQETDEVIPNTITVEQLVAELAEVVPGGSAQVPLGGKGASGASNVCQKVKRLLEGDEFKALVPDKVFEAHNKSGEVHVKRVK